MKRATIKDIAREANVSLATVSRSLNHDPCVTDAMRTRVLETAKRLGVCAQYHCEELENQQHVYHRLSGVRYFQQLLYFHRPQRGGYCQQPEL